MRNTDFNHLKDGLIKSILAHPKSKEMKTELGWVGRVETSVYKTRDSSENHLLYLEMLDGARWS